MKCDDTDDTRLREQTALFRYGLIADLLHLSEKKSGLYKKLAEKAERDYQIPGTLRTHVAAETMRDWLTRYRAGGFDALLPKVRGDKGQPRAIPQEIADQLVHWKEEKHDLTVPLLIAKAQASGTLPEGLVLAPATVHRLLSRHGLMLKQPGETDGNDRRRFSFDKAGELWMSDVMHGPAVLVDGKKKRKAYLLALLDDATRLVPYPMPAQLRLMLDLHVAGEGRPFGLEAMAHDALFVQLAGGHVPSVDILYDDLQRFDAEDLARLEQLMAQTTLDRLRSKRPKIVHVDIDTTVAVLFGNQEGALPGPNPRYHGRPSYHPILARVAEVDGICGALLRPGDTAFGDADVPTVVGWLERVREAVGPNCLIRVRIDAAGDCTALLVELERLGVIYYTKAKISQDLADAIALHSPWKSVDHDALGKPTRQTAEIAFQRREWNRAGLLPRVVAARSRDRDNGKQIYLWSHLDYTVQCWITNDATLSAEEIAAIYNDRAGIEPVIGELKSAWCIGKAPSAVFDASHAAFLIKLLAHNLYRWFLDEQYAPLAAWRTTWARRVTILRPGRLIRSGRSTTLRTTPVFMPPLQC